MVSLILAVSYCSPYWPTGIVEWNKLFSCSIFVAHHCDLWTQAFFGSPKIQHGCWHPSFELKYISSKSLSLGPTFETPNVCVFSYKLTAQNLWPQWLEDQWWPILLVYLMSHQGVKLHLCNEPLAEERVWCLQSQCTGYTSRLLLGWCLPTLDDLGILWLEETFPKLMPNFFWWSLTASYHCDTAWVHS